MHWGMEGQGVPSSKQRNLARFMSRQGVHAIIGAHPHRLLPHEYINKTLVVYSLGNFLFAMNWLNKPVSRCKKVAFFNVVCNSPLSTAVGTLRLWTDALIGQQDWTIGFYFID